MKHKSLLSVLILALALLPGDAQAAHAPRHHGYICQVRFSHTSPQSVRYEIRGERLYGFEDDYTGKPNIYDLRTNSEATLVAVRQQTHPRVVTVTIDKKNRRYTQILRIGKKIFDRNIGYCARF